MKTKLIIIIISVVILVSAIVVASCVLFNDTANEETTEAIEESPDISKIGILRIDTISEMKDFLKNNELVLQTSDDNTLFAVGDIGIAGQSVNIFIQTDKDGAFLRVDGSCTVSLSEKNIDELKEKLNLFSYVVSEIFELEYPPEYDIYSAEGALIKSSTSDPVEKMLTENASCGISAIDVDDSYWNFCAHIEDESLKIKFFHSYQTDLYEYESANIILNDDFVTEVESTDSIDTFDVAETTSKETGDQSDEVGVTEPEA